MLAAGSVIANFQFSFFIGFPGKGAAIRQEIGHLFIGNRLSPVVFRSNRQFHRLPTKVHILFRLQFDTDLFELEFFDNELRGKALGGVLFLSCRKSVISNRRQAVNSDL